MLPGEYELEVIFIYSDYMEYMYYNFYNNNTQTEIIMYKIYKYT